MATVECSTAQVVASKNASSIAATRRKVSAIEATIEIGGRPCIAARAPAPPVAAIATMMLAATAVPTAFVLAVLMTAPT
jgi:hypothetical protein